MAILSQKIGFLGCSIVVHAGEYNLLEISLGEQEKSGFYLEIIGLEEVQISCVSKNGAVFSVASDWDLSLKNLTFYGCPATSATQDTDSEQAIGVIKAKLALLDVRMFGSNGYPLLCVGGSELRVINCEFSNFNTPFAIHELFGTVERQSKATMFQCQIKKVDAESVPMAISCLTGGKIVMTECLISGFTASIKASGSISKVILNRCKLLDGAVAVRSELNASVLVADCDLFTDVILLLRRTEKRSIQFQRNSIKPRGSALGTAYVMADPAQEFLVDHDFDRLRVLPFKDDSKADYFARCAGANRKAREELAKFRLDIETPWLVGRKYCMHCEASEEPDAKFKYCSRCRKVAYCSEKCKDADWVDHKIMCEKS